MIVGYTLQIITILVGESKIQVPKVFDVAVILIGVKGFNTRGSSK